MRVTLASASPRRRELLTLLLEEFDCVSADIDETPKMGEMPEDYVLRMAVEKASSLKNQQGAVIGSDTVVVLSDNILQKPVSVEEARGMLEALSGQTHQVMTAVAMLINGELMTTVSTTEVTFAPLEKSLIEAYLARMNPGTKRRLWHPRTGWIFVRSIHGSYSSVVGLPLYETRGCSKARVFAHGWLARMLERAYRFTVGFLWRSLLVLLVGLAVAVSTTTVLLSMLPSVNEALTETIEARTGFSARIGSLEGEMSGFQPRLKVVDFALYQPSLQSTTEEPFQPGSKNALEEALVFQAGQLQITVNPWRSLLQRQLILSERKARNVEIPARLENAAGSIVIPIYPGIFASEIERLTLQNTRVMLLRDQGEDEDQLLLEVDLDLKRDGSLRELQLSARGGGDLTINAAGSGVGDPFDLRGFKGNIEGQITATDIAAMAGFLTSRFLDGDILWTDAADGVFASTFKADGEVSIETDGNSSNQIALSVLGVAESQGGGAWLNMSHIELALDRTRLALEDIHLGLFEDSWSLVMNDVDVSDAIATIIGTNLLPTDLVEIVQPMGPRGALMPLVSPVIIGNWVFEGLLWIFITLVS